MSLADSHNNLEKYHDLKKKHQQKHVWLQVKQVLSRSDKHLIDVPNFENIVIYTIIHIWICN